jgi:protein-tyrosine phosphatase
MGDFNMVTNRVATGGAVDADALLAVGLNVIVDAREIGPAEVKPGMHYLWNPTLDDGEPKPTEYWQRTLSFVLPLLAQPGYKAYLNCAWGVNRGPSNAFAVLVALGLPPELAEQLIRRARPQVELRYKADALAACQTLGYVL